MISVKKKHRFSSRPRANLSTMGQPGAAGAQPLYKCVLDKQVVFVNKNFCIYTLSIWVFFSTLLPKVIHSCKTLQFTLIELGSLNLPF